MNSTTIAAPVKTSRVLFDATRRHPAPRTFGRGILRSLPTYRCDHSIEDERWAAQVFNNLDAERAYADAASDAEWDREAEALARAYDQERSGR